MYIIIQVMSSKNNYYIIFCVAIINIQLFSKISFQKKFADKLPEIVKSNIWIPVVNYYGLLAIYLVSSYRGIRRKTKKMDTEILMSGKNIIFKPISNFYISTWNTALSNEKYFFKNEIRISYILLCTPMLLLESDTRTSYNPFS